MNPVSPAAPAPSSPPAPPASAGGGSGGEFSNALTRAQQARDAERQTERHLERRAEGQRAARGSHPATDKQAAAAPTRSPATEGDARGPADASAASGATDTADARPAAGQDTDAAQSGAQHATLPVWLESVLGRPTPAGVGRPEGAADTDGSAFDALTDPDAVGSAAAPGSQTTGQAREALNAALARYSRADAGSADDGDADGTTQAAWSQAGPLSAATDGGAQVPGTPAGALAASATGLAGAGQAGPAGSAAVPERQIHTPLHSPAFAPALGAQLRLMVQDGVTEARLNLNPAEMGPISVQIRIEGQHARVEMAAELAVTRQALEQAMPALAGALRESGLTLTGGGVFEHARDARQADADGGSGRGGGRDGNDTGGPADLADAEAGVPGAAAPRGMVDLYA